LHERTIDFEKIYGELLQLLQIEIPGTEIVNGKTDTCFLQYGQGAQAFLRILHQGRFGKLQF